MTRVTRPQIDGRQAALPVVRVDDVGPEARRNRGLERHPRERGIPPRVVRMVVTACSVKSFPIVKLGDVDQPGRRAGPERALVDGRVVTFGTDRHGQTHERRAANCRSTVTRQHHRHAMPKLTEGGRQRRDHVRKATRLGEGNGLGRNHQNVEALVARARDGVT